MNTEEYQTRYGIDPEYIDADGNVYDYNDLETHYAEMLNGSGPVIIGGLSYDHAVAFEAVDSIAYHIGMADYQNALEWDEWTENHEWIVDEDEDEDGPVCEDCAEALSEDEATVSLSYLGRLLCEGCGKYEA